MDRESTHVQRYRARFLTAKGYIQSLTESLQISTGGVKPAATVSFRSIQASLHYGSDLTELGAGKWPFILRSLRLLKHEQGLKSFSVLVYHVTLLIKNNHSTCQIEKEP